MAKILYGVCNVGMGHAIRSKVILQHLEKKHEILIIAADPVYTYLKKHFKNVHKIPGWKLIFKNNRVKPLRTIIANARQINSKTKQNIKRTYKKIQKFKPQIAISDWETVTGHMAKKLQIPLVAIDNEKYLTSGKYTVPLKYIPSYLLTRLTIAIITKKADSYLVLLLPGNKIKEKQNIHSIPPILRKEILQATPKKGKKVVVYETTQTDKKLLKILKKINQEFIIYGYNIKRKVNNLEFKEFTDKGFTKDIINAKAIITTGGFSLISEANALGKPMLVIPIKTHFEQQLNAMYVQKKQCGIYYSKLTTKRVQRFLNNIDKYKCRAEKFTNNQALGILDWIIKEKTE